MKKSVFISLLLLILPAAIIFGSEKFYQPFVKDGIAYIPAPVVESEDLAWYYAGQEHLVQYNKNEPLLVLYGDPPYIRGDSWSPDMASDFDQAKKLIIGNKAYFAFKVTDEMREARYVNQDTGEVKDGLRFNFAQLLNVNGVPQIAWVKIHLFRDNYLRGHYEVIDQNKNFNGIVFSNKELNEF